jgi:hypothetical protein
MISIKMAADQDQPIKFNLRPRTEHENFNGIA